jgi:GNAT superfamily N-acetyltransferase
MPFGELPHGYRARPATPGDVESVSSVIAACEAEHGQGIGTTPDVVRHFWSTLDLASHTLVIEAPAGEIVAAADIENQGYVSVSIYGHVHPEHRGLGLGSFIVDWGERWARAHRDLAPQDAEVVTRHLIPVTDEAAQALLTGHGYQRLRATYIMKFDLDAPPPDPVWPSGIRQAPYRPGVDEREIHEALEDTFRDVWGRPRSSFERFLGNRPDRASQSDLWIVARDDRTIAGICLGKLLDGRGWIDNVGVRRPWRRRGLGLALLHVSFAAYYRRGVSDVRLGVDSESLTGAPRLYERAGMRIESSSILFQKELGSS